MFQGWDGPDIGKNDRSPSEANRRLGGWVQWGCSPNSGHWGPGAGQTPSPLLVPSAGVRQRWQGCGKWTGGELVLWRVTKTRERREEGRADRRVAPVKPQHY